jgi:hypothetical protein
MSEMLNEAMLELAHLKFTDQYCSVSSHGFMPTPAVKGVEVGGKGFKILRL